MNSLAEDLERFRRGAEVLATVLTGAAGEEVDFVPAPGKWSIRQIMAHLADGELVGAFRLRLVIAEDNPTLTAFDQDAWTRNLDYARRKPTQSLDTFRRLRGSACIRKTGPCRCAACSPGMPITPKATPASCKPFAPSTKK